MKYTLEKWHSHLPVCSHLQAESPVSFVKPLPAHHLCGAEAGQGKA